MACSNFVPVPALGAITRPYSPNPINSHALHHSQRERGRLPYPGCGSLPPSQMIAPASMNVVRAVLPARHPSGLSPMETNGANQARSIRMEHDWDQRLLAPSPLRLGNHHIERETPRGFFASEPISRNQGIVWNEHLHKLAPHYEDSSTSTIQRHTEVDDDQETHEERDQGNDNRGGHEAPAMDIIIDDANVDMLSLAQQYAALTFMGNPHDSY